MSDRGAAPPALALQGGGGPAVLWSLNGLRAAGALLVMLYHINSWDLQVIRGSSAGFTGVGLFFVLSGFVLTWTVRPGTTVGTFYLRRLARIYPNHLVAFLAGLVLTIAVLGTTPDPVAVITGLTLTQSWSPDQQVVFAVNGVAWSLSCEIAFYAVFPLLVWGLRRLSARVRVAVAAVALLVPAVLGTVWPALVPLLFHLPPSRLPEFVLGMVTAMAVQEGWRPRIPAPVLLAALAAGILAAARFDPSPVVMTAVLAAIFAPLAARCARGDMDGRNHWARRPVVMVAGALSFAFYLVHELVIRALVATPLRGPVTIPIVTVVSVVLAFAMYRGVEIPARRLLLGLTHPRTWSHDRVDTPGRPRHSRPRSATWSAPVGGGAGATRRHVADATPVTAGAAPASAAATVGVPTEGAGPVDPGSASVGPGDATADLPGQPTGARVAEGVGAETAR